MIACLQDPQARDPQFGRLKCADDFNLVSMFGKLGRSITKIEPGEADGQNSDESVVLMSEFGLDMSNSFLEDYKLIKLQDN